MRHRPISPGVAAGLALACAGIARGQEPAAPPAASPQQEPVQQEPVQQEPVQGAAAQSGRPARAPRVLDREAALGSIERAADFLVGRQGRDGSWGIDGPESTLELGFAWETYYSWKMASHGIVCMALARVPETPERRAAFEDAVRWLCTHRLPIRDSDWDIDYVWTALYGFVSTLDLLDDPRLAGGEWPDLVRGRAQQFLDVLLKNQAASGGWAYYDDPPFDVTPTWATSFCTALVLPSLVEAQGKGFEVPERVVQRAQRYLERCALPNGAYAYDLSPVPRIAGVESINLIQGSLGRTQVGNWARRRLGDARVTDDVLREGLEAFFTHHGYLDHARTRPIPHEGFHANAGYFYFFGHYYASKVISLLPEAEREAWHARLRPHLVKTQWASGGACDFLDAPYTINAGTSYLILALTEGAGPGLNDPASSADEGGGR